jgi:hypothetical protein
MMAREDVKNHERYLASDLVLELDSNRPGVLRIIKSRWTDSGKEWHVAPALWYALASAADHQKGPGSLGHLFFEHDAFECHIEGYQEIQERIKGLAAFGGYVE